MEAQVPGLALWMRACCWRVWAVPAHMDEGSPLQQSVQDQRRSHWRGSGGGSITRLKCLAWERKMSGRHWSGLHLLRRRGINFRSSRGNLALGGWERDGRREQALRASPQLVVGLGSSGLGRWPGVNGRRKLSNLFSTEPF